MDNQNSNGENEGDENNNEKSNQKYSTSPEGLIRLGIIVSE